MTYEGHVSTGMYSYIGFTGVGSAEEAARVYREIEEAFKPQAIGMSDTEFRAIYDKVALGQPIQDDPGILEKMNPLQRFATNEAKKHYKRITK